MKTTRCLNCQSDRLTFWAKAADLEYFSTPHTFEYWRCDACESLSISPVPLGQLDAIYPSNYYSFEVPKPSLLHWVKDYLDAKRFHRLLKQIPGASLKVLDVGGGTGWMHPLLLKSDPRIARILLLDTDASAVATATRLGREAVCGDLARFDTSEKFDLILLLNLIEHVEDPNALLRKAKQLLSPQGLVLIKTPNAGCAESRWLRHRNWGAFHCPRHWVLFSSHALEGALSRAHLEPVRLEFTQGATFWASTILMLAHRKGWVKLGPQRPVHRHFLYAPLCAVAVVVDLVRTFFVSTSQMFVTVKHAS
jgi:2-polyprenyl-3-methyl-5-hydroxy-6-metoxy-1,4-benzoquinol methylase